MTDRELNGLTGKVATVRLEWKEIKTFPGQKEDPNLIYLSTEFYDLNGRQSETHYKSGNKTVFSTIDGTRAFTTKSSPARDREGILTTTSNTDNIPLDKNEKITTPDTRYEFKLTYDLDNKGRITAERELGNNGKVWYIRTFEYDKSGRLSREVRNDTVAITKYKFKYDKNGLLIELIEERNIKGPGRDSIKRTVFSEYVIDDQGNWTAREAHIFYTGSAMPEYNSPEEKYDTIRAEYRTLTYHK